MFYTWKKVEDPNQGWFASKTSGWSPDSFSGGLEVDFSSVIPVGTKAVLCCVQCNYNSTDVAGEVYVRKSGDTKISNTPSGSSESSHRIQASYPRVTYIANQSEIWLSTDYKAQFAVKTIVQDLFISYPAEYLL